MGRNRFVLDASLAVQKALAAAPRLFSEGDIRVANPKGGPPVVLRGPIGVQSGDRQGRYLVDPTDPQAQKHMIRRADPQGRTAYIEPYPASNLGVRRGPSAQQMRDFAAGKPVDPGPRVSFINDNRSNPSPNRPITAATAGMIAGAIIDSGLRSVNINSTTGGHGNRGRHPQGKAVDINRVDGKSVGLGVGRRNPAALPEATALQDALGRQTNLIHNFGPAYQTKIRTPGGPAPEPSMRYMHQNHVHGGGKY